MISSPKSGVRPGSWVRGLQLNTPAFPLTRLSSGAARARGRGSFFKPRGRALYDVKDLDEFIRSGIRISSVRASREERNVALSTR
jgi:hypothetical protein